MRRLATLTVALVAAAGLSACGGGDDATDTTDCVSAKLIELGRAVYNGTLDIPARYDANPGPYLMSLAIASC